MLSFEEIDNRRSKAGLTRKAVYDRAGVDGETWRRLARGEGAQTRTLEKLTAALDELTKEKEASDA